MGIANPILAPCDRRDVLTSPRSNPQGIVPISKHGTDRLSLQCGPLITRRSFRTVRLTIGTLRKCPLKNGVVTGDVKMAVCPAGSAGRLRGLFRTTPTGMMSPRSNPVWSRYSNDLRTQ